MPIVPTTSGQIEQLTAARSSEYYTREYAVERMKRIDPRHSLSASVMVVGLCPSSLTDDCSREKYRKSDTIQTIIDWMHCARCYEFDFQNVIPHIVNADPDIGLVNLSALAKRLEPFKHKKVIALGGFVSKVLKLVDIPHLPLYHPSGKTRQLNDFEVRLDQIRKIHNYLKG